MSDLNPTTREAFITGIRQLADWLAVNPQVSTPDFEQRFLLPLSTNEAVTEMAEQLDLNVDYDREGNASLSVRFGLVEFLAYGYLDFTAHVEAAEERNARAWADKNGLEITAVEGGDPR